MTKIDLIFTSTLSHLQAHTGLALFPQPLFSSFSKFPASSKSCHSVKTGQTSVTCERCIGFLFQPCVTLVLPKLKEKGMKHWTHTPVCLTLESTVQSGISQAQKAVRAQGPSHMGHPEWENPQRQGSGPAVARVWRGAVERAGEDRHVLQLGRDGG